MISKKFSWGCNLYLATAIIIIIIKVLIANSVSNVVIKQRSSV